ncbi:MAG: VOC family protein [archaeon]|nr:MAG: VOC family protein [archaeon]
MDSVVHFEIPADDTNRAKDFYAKAFGWQLNDWENSGYFLVGTTPSDQNGTPTSPGSINGGLGKRTGPLSVPTVTLKVDDIDAKLDMIKKLGGSVVGQKSAVGNIGWSAYFKDTEGNVIGLWQSAQKM